MKGKSVDNLVEELRAIAHDGYGSVFDSIGTNESFSTSLAVLGQFGTLVEMAIHNQEMSLNLMKLGGERKIHTSCNFEPRDYPVAMSWLESGRFAVREWLTEVKLPEIPGIFEEISGSDGSRKAFKLLIRF